MPLVFIRPPPNSGNSDFEYGSVSKRQRYDPPKNPVILSTSPHRPLDRDPTTLDCPCPVPQSRCSAFPGTVRTLRSLLKNVDQSFLALDSEGNPGDFSWPKSVQLTIILESDEFDLSQYYYSLDPDFLFFQWLSSSHDNDSPPFERPGFLGSNFSSEKHGPKAELRSRAFLYFMFPESVVLMRSSFVFHLKQLRHNWCDQTVVFSPGLKLNILFACEVTSDYNCFQAIPPYSPYCVTPENMSTSLVERKGWNAVVEVKLNNLPFDNPTLPNPNLEYAALYGPCAAQLQTFGYKLGVTLKKDRCQLKLDGLWKKSICQTPFKNCISKSVIQIPHVYSSLKYGILLCSFYKDMELPNNMTMLRQLAFAQILELPASLLHHNPSLLKNSGEIRTFIAYGSILVILFGLLMITLIQKRRQRKPLAANMLQFLKADEWELDESDVLIHFAYKIGNGSTSEVYRGKLSKDFQTPANGPVVLDESQQVAIKILKKNVTEVQKSEFLSEVEINKLIGRHNRIVNLIGVMQLRRPPLIVFEYCPNGDLRRFLHKSRQYAWELESKGFLLSEMEDIHAIPQVNEEFVFTLKRIVRLAIQICLGMEFLASRQIIHADLATRNVFLTAKNSIKIGDFGMSRKESDSAKLHTCTLTDNRVRWAAPEVLQREFQCLASDVWSFGVVLYELASLGGIPYHEICDSSVLPGLLNDGERLRKPNYCPEDIYSVMTACWSLRPENRPNFSEIANLLTESYDSIDTKDNRQNFYVIPDPDKSLYTLPLIKKDTPPSTAIPQAQSVLGLSDSAPSTPKKSVSQYSLRAKTAKNLVTKAVSNASPTPGLKDGPEIKVELIQETERLLGFS
ncbi:hypothetical protein FO519_004461 [Halicephalobus sp. NKZ332]|nr:hypothetical protein FO519_004461 [Halicephalobus sp. NKZ332]